MRQPDSPKNLEKKLSRKYWHYYFKDVQEIEDAKYVPIKLRQELYKKIWPLEYNKIPKNYLKRYRIVLDKLGSLIRQPLRKFIFDSFYSVKEVKKEIKKWEAIANTIEYFENEKGFKKYKKKSEVLSVIFFADSFTAKWIAGLWKLLRSGRGYNQLDEKEIKDICRYYNRKMKSK